MKLNKNTKLFINYFLGPLLFVWLSWTIYRQIVTQPNLQDAWKQIRSSLHSSQLWSLVVVLLLMLVNWGLEAIKWKISVKTVQEVSFLKACQAVFSGVSFSITTPNRIGEYLGRMFFMSEGNRLRTISVTLISNLSQLIITFIAGVAGLLLLKKDLLQQHFISAVWMDVILAGVIIFLFLLLLAYFRIDWLAKWINRMPGRKRFAFLVQALEEFHPALQLQLLFLSLLRFIVFIVQYGLLFSFFGVTMSAAEICWTISVSFLMLAIIPSIGVAELPQRNKVVTAIAGIYSSNELGLTFTTTGIWFINLILPALIGSFFILRLRKIVTSGNIKQPDQRSEIGNN